MSPQDLYLLEDSLEDPFLEPPEPFRAMPELRQYLLTKRPDDEIGLRALLEHPDSVYRARTRRLRNVERRVSSTPRIAAAS